MATTPPNPVPPPPPPTGYAPPAENFGGPAATPIPESPSGRNRVAGVLALLGAVVVLVGTFLPIVEFDFGDLGAFSGGLDDSLNGWGSGINDGPIHFLVSLAPLAAGVAILRGGAKKWTKVLLIVAAVIGFFWISIRFADISGSLEEEAGAGDLVQEVSDPGVGLYAMTAGWVMVLIAGLLTKTSKRSTAPASF